MPYSRQEELPTTAARLPLGLYRPNDIGYTPKAYVSAPNGPDNDPLLGRIAPIFASNLTTLLGTSTRVSVSFRSAHRPGHFLAPLRE